MCSGCVLVNRFVTDLVNRFIVDIDKLLLLRSYSLFCTVQLAKKPVKVAQLNSTNLYHLQGMYI